MFGGAGLSRRSRCGNGVLSWRRFVAELNYNLPILIAGNNYIVNIVVNQVSEIKVKNCFLPSFLPFFKLASTEKMLSSWYYLFNN